MSVILLDNIYFGWNFLVNSLKIVGFDLGIIGSVVFVVKKRGLFIVIVKDNGGVILVIFSLGSVGFKL